ncbi:putative membrane protein [Nicoletella semolina]|uniref:UPF0283 membrane protein EV693_101183 n=1 Tax=Nicoletella semolina TaxID=271160 RepID=A0A4V2SKB5_9PAST|nr:TIGR01620 family protein [Nicoletella semolina]MDH2924188.1 hypothetical protein [Nicoletella semolina]TCP18916.1 putative membrane protein [Nicoletella semolina]
MEKRIFSEQQDTSSLPAYQAKREFSTEDVIIEDNKELEEIKDIALSVEPRSRFWIRLFLAGVGLFVVAVFAQSVQWIIETWRANEWIYLVFSLAFFAISLVGVSTLIREWRKLVWLGKYRQFQQTSEQLRQGISQASGEQAVDFCKKVFSNATSSAFVKKPLLQQGKQRFFEQLDEAYNSQEVLYLFSENVLVPIDKQMKKLISKSASENALIVALSPLALVDVLFIAWRNIRLVNQITQAYGMELGYFSRLALFKMVLKNMAFAGVAELATDIGGEVFSQSLTARFSARAAQGIGVGLLTARLGIKAMEFCRPIAFQANERPKLSVVRQELLGVLKERLFRKNTEKAVEKER